MSGKNRVYGEKERVRLLVGGLPIWAIVVKRAGRMVVPEFMPKRVVHEFIEKMYERFIKGYLEQLPERLREWRIVMQYHQDKDGNILCFFWSEKYNKWHYYWGDPRQSLIGEFIIFAPSFSLSQV